MLSTLEDLFNLARNRKKNPIEGSYTNKLLKDNYFNLIDGRDESIDSDIYDKFLMFLKFKEKMKQRDF